MRPRPILPSKLATRRGACRTCCQKPDAEVETAALSERHTVWSGPEDLFDAPELARLVQLGPSSPQAIRISSPHAGGSWQEAGRQVVGRSAGRQTAACGTGAGGWTRDAFARRCVPSGSDCIPVTVSRSPNGASRLVRPRRRLRRTEPCLKLYTHGIDRCSHSGAPEGPRLTQAGRGGVFRADADPWGFILFARNLETPDQVRRLTRCAAQRRLAARRPGADRSGRWPRRSA